jgi:predicted RNA-binding Zn ribbon-like protein
MTGLFVKGSETMKTHWTCLEFTRTVGWAQRDRPDDELTSYEALLAWAEREALVEMVERERLSGKAARHPDEAARVLEHARVLRALIYRIFSAVGKRRTPEPSDIEQLNELVAGASKRRGIVPAGSGYEWGWLEDPDSPLDRVLWPIIYSAAALLTWSDLDRVKLCRADDCGWLFVDASRNRSRRWCDMSDCGNRAKAQRFRARHGDAR